MGSLSSPGLQKLAISVYLLVFPVTIILPLACIYFGGWNAALIYVGYLIFINSSYGMEASRTASWTPWLRRWKLWDHFAAYFPARIIKTHDLPADKGPYLFNVAPHGVCVYSAWAAFDTDGCGFPHLFPGLDVRALTLKSNFRLPLVREFLLLHGVCDVSKKSCLSILSRGPASGIMLAAGGASESLLTQPGCYDLVLAKRKGFVRVALQTGASLVPVLFFGENDLYEVHIPQKGSSLEKLQTNMLRYLGFTIPLFWGVGFFGGRGLLPRRMPLNIVIGKPLKVGKFEGSTHSEEFAQQVDSVHQQYTASLIELWDAHKNKFAADRRRSLQK
uniref:Acyltransferase n=1 Tax=Dunaliella tertiolecta TaxID=3047 RepID=A0A6S8IM82_DUNTE|mmetsp:Transcript_18587/g.52248  ORF Transcript_18587/g.52248 Transcript_18587/m.52248 type:complete len:332 (-) Transcript_18587:445-1440(-)